MSCVGNSQVKQAAVSWARKGSGFTLLFESLVMTMAKEMAVNAISRQAGESDTRLWRVIRHYTEEARSHVDMSNVKKIGMDETASRRGHEYVSLFVDLERRCVLFATEGKDAETCRRFREDLEAHGGKAENIAEVSCDMSPAFIRGVTDQFENAEITFDKFHTMKLINEALDETRRDEQKQHPELKRTRYAWLKNETNLTARQAEEVEFLSMKKWNLKTARAYQIKLAFQEFWTQPPDKAEAFLKKWYFWATHSRLPAVIKAAKTIKEHWSGILRWFRSNITNAILEGINSLVQAAKARARGYRTNRNFITMIYLIAGKLDFDLPT